MNMPKLQLTQSNIQRSTLLADNPCHLVHTYSLYPYNVPSRDTVVSKLDMGR